MNAQQALWWVQAQSDYEVLEHLRRQSFAPCHQLHYLQMATEKLGKAYYWRNGDPPPKSHAAFVRFLQLLNSRGRDRSRIAGLLGFNSADQFEWWIRLIAPLAHEVEKLAPSIAGDDGPNPEYPWPTEAPANTPCQYRFAIETDLSSSLGRQLLSVLGNAIRQFPQFA